MDHMRAMKHRAIVCNIGHFDSEIQIESLRNYKWENVKPQVDEVVFPDGKRLIVLSEGRLVNLGNATGHPSFVMSASFTNQVLAQIELFTAPPANTSDRSTRCRSTSTRRWRRCISPRSARHLTKLSPKQADYIGVNAAGPFKHELYRYEAGRVGRRLDAHGHVTGLPHTGRSGRMSQAIHSCRDGAYSSRIARSPTKRGLPRFISAARLGSSRLVFERRRFGGTIG